VSAHGPRIDVAIDELVLFGLPASARYAVADALQAELAWLLAGDGPAAWGEHGGVSHVDHLVLGPVTIPSSARGTGRAVARAVHGGLADDADGGTRP
jgi:hypothetical protein